MILLLSLLRPAEELGRLLLLEADRGYDFGNKEPLFLMTTTMVRLLLGDLSLSTKATTDTTLGIEWREMTPNVMITDGQE